MRRIKFLRITCATAITTWTVTSSSTRSQDRILKYKNGKKEVTIEPLVQYSKRHEYIQQRQQRQRRQRHLEEEEEDKQEEFIQSTIHTYHSSPLSSPPHSKYSARSKTPKKRSDLNPLEPIDPLRFVQYDYHPYQQQLEKDSEKRRELRTREEMKPGAPNGSRPPKVPIPTSQDTISGRSPHSFERNPLSKRSSAATDLFQPLRIHYDTTELDSWTSSNNDNSTSSSAKLTQARISYLTNYVLPSTAQLWSESLGVIPSSTPLKIDYEWCPFAHSKNSPSFTSGVENADLIIFVTANGEVCENGNVLASAHSCYWDQFQRPIAGNIDFCLDTIEEDGHLMILKEEMMMMQMQRLEMGRNFMEFGGWSLQDVSSSSRVNDEYEEEQTPDKKEEEEENNTDDKTKKGEKEEESIPALTPLTKEEEELLSSQRAESNKLLAMAIGTAMHEFAHVLGVTSDDLLFFYDSQTGLPRTPSPVMQTVDCITPGSTKDVWMPSESTIQKTTTQYGAQYFEIVTPTVTQVVRNQFNCDKATGARLENQPTNGDCFGSHFEERYYLTENMSPVLGGVPEVLSSLTLALLHDSGWYEPNYEMARVSPFGHGAGCDFLEKPCIDKATGNLPEFSRGYFCNVEYKLGGGDGKEEKSLGCDATHTHMGHCDLVNYEELKRLEINAGGKAGVGTFDPPGEEYLYFPDNKFLGALMETTDFCPTYSIDPISCREVSTATTSGVLPKFNNIPLLSQQLESTGPSSRCFNTNSVRPICLNARCDDESHTVQVMIGQKTITCEEDGQVFLLPGTDVEVECPKLADMCPDLICPANCAGHGKCDYSLSNPECRCFDESDKSPGCYNSFKTIGPQGGWDDLVSSGSESVMKLSNVVLYGVISVIYLCLQ